MVLLYIYIKFSLIKISGHFYERHNKICFLQSSFDGNSFSQVCNHPCLSPEGAKVPPDLQHLTLEAQGGKLAVVSNLLHALRSGTKEKIVLVSLSTKVRTYASSSLVRLASPQLVRGFMASSRFCQIERTSFF